MNSKLGEGQTKKVITSEEVLISTQMLIKNTNSQNDDGLMLGRLLGLDSADTLRNQSGLSHFCNGLSIYASLPCCLNRYVYYNIFNVKS